MYPPPAYGSYGPAPDAYGQPSYDTRSSPYGQPPPSSGYPGQPPASGYPAVAAASDPYGGQGQQAAYEAYYRAYGQPPPAYGSTGAPPATAATYPPAAGGGSYPPAQGSSYPPAGYAGYPPAAGTGAAPYSAGGSSASSAPTGTADAAAAAAAAQHYAASAAAAQHYGHYGASPYGAPSPGYPAGAYGAPPPGYGMPPPGYGQPAPGYGVAPGYGPPAGSGDYRRDGDRDRDRDRGGRGGRSGGNNTSKDGSRQGSSGGDRKGGGGKGDRRGGGGKGDDRGRSGRLNQNDKPDECKTTLQKKLQGQPSWLAIWLDGLDPPRRSVGGYASHTTQATNVTLLIFAETRKDSDGKDEFGFLLTQARSGGKKRDRERDCTREMAALVDVLPLDDMKAWSTLPPVESPGKAALKDVSADDIERLQLLVRVRCPKTTIELPEPGLFVLVPPSNGSMQWGPHERTHGADAEFQLLERFEPGAAALHKEARRVSGIAHQQWFIATVWAKPEASEDTRPFMLGVGMATDKDAAKVRAYHAAEQRAQILTEAMFVRPALLKAPSDSTQPAALMALPAP